VLLGTVSSEDVAQGKPSPDVYLAAAAGLKIDPLLCVAVEDSANGFRSAAAAGMPVVVGNRTRLAARPCGVEPCGCSDRQADGLTDELVASLRHC
jgi:beta-phosphoglucomutase-like phosphatase (HAD superfamily)